MKLTTKSEYALISLMEMSANKDQKYTLKELSNKLDISKIYLEQIFSVLKKNNIVSSLKGPKGGYYLTTSPKDLTVYDILVLFELNMFTTYTKDTNKHKEVLIEHITDVYDYTLKNVFTKITFELLATNLSLQDDIGNMFYI